MRGGKSNRWLCSPRKKGTIKVPATNRALLDMNDADVPAPWGRASWLDGMRGSPSTTGGSALWLQVTGSKSVALLQLETALCLRGCDDDSKGSRSL